MASFYSVTNRGAKCGRQSLTCQVYDSFVTSDGLIVGGGIIGCSIAWRLAQRGLKITVVDSGKIGSYLFSQHKIYTTPIVHEEFQGLRITPNLYTTLPELDRFCELMAEIARKGLPA